MRLTEVVGRTDDVAAVHERLLHSRLVSITGPGGIGKTTVATVVAEELASPFVDLTNVAEGRDVPAEIVTALGLPIDPGRPIIEQLPDAIARDSTLVLDNVEGVADAGPAVEALLGSVPGLRIVITSRTPLRIAGEAALPLSPLALPHVESWEAVESSPAGQLLLNRARAVGGAVESRPEDARWIAQICRRLDGIPLALELAAGQLRVMTPEGLLQGLEGGTSTLRDARRPSRQRSLDAVIEWSLDQLSREEYETLAAASLTAGGFGLELLRGMAGDDAAVHLDALISLGLVAFSAAPGRRRFRVLETIRDAILARLDPTLRAGLLRRHAAAMHALVKRTGAQLDRPDESDTEVLSIERDNLRLALNWAVATDSSMAVDLVARLGMLWFETGAISEGIEWIDRAMATVRHDEEAELHLLATRVSLEEKLIGDGSMDAAARLGEQAHRAPPGVASVRALAYAAIALSASGSPDAETWLDRARERADAAGLVRWLPRLQLSFALNRSGIDPPGVTIERLEEAAAGAGRVGDVVTEALILGNLMEELTDLRESERAEQAGRRALELIAGRNPTHQAWILASLAANAAQGGQAGQARADLVEALRLIEQHPALHIVDAVLASTVAVLVANGHDELAGRAIGLNEALGERLGIVRVPSDVAIIARRRRAVARRLGEVRMRVMEDQGRVADPVALVREVIEVLERAAGSTRVTHERIRVRHGELTRREAEVLGLLAQGKSDIDIAAELSVTASTASVHVSNVKGKLGVKTRLEAAMKGRELGL